VVHRREGDLRPDLVTKIFKHCTIEILVVINGDLLRNSITIDDVLLEKFLDGGRGYVGYGLRFNPFGEILHYDNDECVIPLCWCEFTHDVEPQCCRGQDGAISYEGCVGAMQRCKNF
jgi:hypothetical protein